MSNLVFTVVGARVEPYAAVPTLVLRLEIAETAGEQIHMIALRCQVQIEARRRHYSASEKPRLAELYGEPERWGETLRAMVWTHVAQMVPGFTGRVEVDLPITCTYDLEVAAVKYFEALEEGEIPLLLQFSGTVFTARGGAGQFSVAQLPWSKETSYRLPVRVWREAMEHYFPGTAWIRLRRESVDALLEFKGRRALLTWDHVVATLLESAAMPAGQPEAT
jgi:hypothetical protein